MSSSNKPNTQSGQSQSVKGSNPAQNPTPSLGGTTPNGGTGHSSGSAGCFQRQIVSVLGVAAILSLCLYLVNLTKISNSLQLTPTPIPSTGTVIVPPTPTITVQSPLPITSTVSTAVPPPSPPMIAETCADDMLGDRGRGTTISLNERYYRATDEYRGDKLNMNMIVDTIYGTGESGKIDQIDKCVTDSLYKLGTINSPTIEFNPPSNHKYSRIWLIVSASQEDNRIAKGEPVGTITIGNTVSIPLVWGKNIAHWSMSDDAKTFSSNDSSGLILRIFDYHKINGAFHVSQLFLIGVDIPENEQTHSVTLRDDSNHVDVAVLGAIWGPALVPSKPSTVAYCVKDIKKELKNVLDPNPRFSDYFQGYTDQGISTDCSDVRFAQGAINVPFRFSSYFIRTKTIRESNGKPLINFTLNQPSYMHANYLYLVVSVRNFCIARTKEVGTITIADTNAGQQPIKQISLLNLEENVRQARSGLSDCTQLPFPEMLYLPSPSEGEIIGLSGLPLRTRQDRPNEPVDNNPSEMWLDLIKIKLPDALAQGQPISVLIEPFLSQDNGETAFIAVYAATLVHEDPTQASAP